jgi:Flp pilus assembly protein TadD
MAKSHPWLAIVALGLTVAWPAQAAGHARAIVIGIRDYVADALTKPLPFADNDASLFEKYIGREFDQPPVLLNTSQSTLHNVKYALNSVLAQAGSGDTIFIFISSRGIARPGADGYIGTSDMSLSKPESTGLPLAFLRQTIKDSDAERVIVFADVCRGPAESFANHINIRLGELGDIAKPLVAGILASQLGHVSEEKDRMSFRTEPTAGYGVFGYFLVDLGSTGKPTVSGLYSALAKQLPSMTQSNQRPREFGSDRAKSVSLRAAVELFDDEKRPGFPRYPPLLASRFLIAGLMAMQTSSAMGRLQAIRAEVLAGAREPRELADEIVRLERDTPVREWESVRDLALIAFANEGQKYVDRYGMQDLLPDDQARVTEEQFARGAVVFEAARKLVSGDRFKIFGDALLVRQLLCQGRLRNPNGLDALMQADRMQAVRIPEVDNALGLFYLEGRPKDYGRAIEQFKKAKRFSPGWMYPRHNLALAYIENGDYASAEREYREAIEHEPLQPALYYNLGLLYHRLNRRAEAEATYDKAIQISGAAIAELRTRAAQWEQRPELRSEAELVNQRANLFKRNEAEVLNAWGALRSTAGDTDGARRKYTEALSHNSELCAARDNLAQLEQNVAERKDRTAISLSAVAILSENSELCGGFYPSQLKLAQLELKALHPDQARALFQRVNNAWPENKESVSGIAAVDAGRALIETIAARRPALASPALYSALAEVYRKAGQTRPCEDTYAFAIEATGRTKSDVSKRELRRRAKRCSSMSP